MSSAARLHIAPHSASFQQASPSIKWHTFSLHDTLACVQAAAEAVERKMPKRLKRKRKIQTDDGLDAGMEEYYDYVFPEEAGAAPNLKLLEAAQAWKRRKQMEATEDGVS